MPEPCSHDSLAPSFAPAKAHANFVQERNRQSWKTKTTPARRAINDCLIPAWVASEHAKTATNPELQWSARIAR